MKEDYPNGAGFRPEIEDVPRNLSDDEDEDDGERCMYCGGDVGDKMVGDEVYTMCVDCGEVQY